MPSPIAAILHMPIKILTTVALLCMSISTWTSVAAADSSTKKLTALVPLQPSASPAQLNPNESINSSLLDDVGLLPPNPPNTPNFSLIPDDPNKPPASFPRNPGPRSPFTPDPPISPNPAGPTGPSCSPAAGGNPGCADSNSGPAVQGKSAPSSGAGNPIDVISGNKYQVETDLAALPGVLGIEIVRHYNSAYAKPQTAYGPFGKGWRLSYETRLAISDSSIQVLQADGARVIFKRTANSASLCITSDPMQGSIVSLKDGYLWRWTNGKTLLFNQAGLLTQITQASGEFLTLNYDKAQRLILVTDPAGRSLQLRYLAKTDQVASVSTPIGVFTYAHSDSNTERGTNLSSVTLPNQLATTRHYHYEDARWPSHLTGISLSAVDLKTPIRQSTYLYDIEGRGVLSTRGIPASLILDAKGDPVIPNRLVAGSGIEQVHLQYLSRPTPTQTGTTVLTSALGHTTTYSHKIIGGAYRVVSVVGVGCETCGPTNVSYAYDNVGRIVQTNQLNTAGSVTGFNRLERDRLGRISSEVNQGVRTQFAYIGNTALMRKISQPSVVKGLVRTTSFDYNIFGQLLSITNVGFSPLQTSTSIERKTVFTYKTIAGRSVRVAKQFGPSQTVYKWDARADRIVAVDQSDSTQTTLGFDSAGRQISNTLKDGYRQRTTIDTLEFQATGAITASSTTTAWLVDKLSEPIESTKQAMTHFSHRYNSLGQRIHSTDSAGRSIHFTYDSVGRLAKTSDQQGNAAAETLDAQNRVAVSSIHRRTGTADAPIRATYFDYAPNGLLRQQLSSDGRLDTWEYDQNNNLAKHIDGYDVQHTFVQNSSGTAHISQTIDGAVRASVAQSSPARIENTTTTLIDDFGQLVKQTLPDHGAKIYEYGATGKLLSIQSEDGSQVRYRWDTNGKLLDKRYAVDQEHTTFSYQGNLMVAANDPLQKTSFEYDALGRPIAQHIQLIALHNTSSNTPKNPPTYSTKTVYDPITGLIQSRHLADGRIMKTRRGTTESGANPEAINLMPAWAAAVEAWCETHTPALIAKVARLFLPSDAIAAEMSVDPINGLTQMNQSNALPTTKTFDTAGRITALKTDGVADLRYGYDVGARITSIAQGSDTAQLFAYSGFGKLVEATRVAPASATAQKVAFNPPNKSTFDALGRTTADDQYTYAYTPAGQLQSVRSSQTSQLIAQYAYNTLRQRIAKTVFDSQGNTLTTGYLWIDGKLVAELDPSGAIATQYVYLNDGRQSSPIAKITKQQIFAIHNDHRGAPIAMTDSNRKIVWRSPESNQWGALSKTSANQTTAQSYDAELNIRMPGQYYDAETGLHDNGRRTYNPQTGRYLQPDPLGYPDGPDAYLYAGGDPLNKTDSQGLYEENVHYYLVFFLARLANFSEQNARTMALASQYVDDNLLTQPTYHSRISLPRIGTYRPNTAALPLYHFTRTAFDDPLFANARDRINNPTSTQLRNLLAPTRDATLPNCTRLQFFGEYLHAFADTFSHRDENNIPFFFNSTVGHGPYNHDPDQTYNVREFVTNQTRTMRMAQEMYQQLQGFSTNAQTNRWVDIEPVVQRFSNAGAAAGNLANRWQDQCDQAPKYNEQCSQNAYDVREAAEREEKIGELARFLSSLNLIDPADLTNLNGKLRYDAAKAAANRSTYLSGLYHRAGQRQPWKFEGILLPSDPLPQ